MIPILKIHSYFYISLIHSKVKIPSRIYPTSLPTFFCVFVTTSLVAVFSFTSALLAVSSLLMLIDVILKIVGEYLKSMF